MKFLLVALLSGGLLAGGVSGALAQAAGSSATTDSKPADSAAKPADSSSSTSASGSVSGSGSVTAPGAPGSTSSSSGIERKTESRTDLKSGDDSASALPRSSIVERTTIFGLSPTAAIIIAAALLLVVVLAIVAMTRSGDTYIDTDRRL